MGYMVKLDSFEGSFDLLYHLINKAEVDIWDISLAEITRQYLDYIYKMKELNVEMASEFMVMAATLLRLKSRLLLPVYEDEEDDHDNDSLVINTKEQLFQRIFEYRKFKEAASMLKEREGKQKKIFVRKKAYNTGERIFFVTSQGTLCPYNMELLAEIWLELQEKNNKKNIGQNFKLPEELRLREKIQYILSYLKKKGQQVYFHLLCPKDSKKSELISSFLAILELASRKRVSLQQKSLFGNILCKIKGKGKIEI